MSAERVRQAERYSLGLAIDHLPIERIRILAKIAEALGKSTDDADTILRAVAFLADEHAAMARNLTDVQRRCGELLAEVRALKRVAA